MNSQASLRNFTSVLAGLLVLLLPPGLPAEGITPGAREGAVSWTDDMGDLWLFGGWGYGSTGSSGYLNDLWRYDPGTDEWTWMKGASTINQWGTYGTQGTPAAANTPGARRGPVSWTDGSGGLWLFGGEGLSGTGTWVALNDLWLYNPGTNEWTWMKGSSTRGESGIYGTQGVPAALNTPGARVYAVSWADGSGDLWLCGGLGLDSTGETGRLNDLWRYTPATDEWTWMKGSNTRHQSGTYGTQGVPAALNTPGARYGAVSWTDGSGKLWLFGGYGYDSAGGYGPLNDLWKYDPVTGEWTWMKGSNTREQPGTYGAQGVPAVPNTPGARVRPVSWTDSSGGLWLFGGYGRDSTASEGRLNDLWRYNPATYEWTWMKGANTIDHAGTYGTQGVPGAGNTPGGRDRAVSWVGDSGGFWLFGGSGRDSIGQMGSLNDLWRYNTDTAEWTWMKGANTVNQPGTYGRGAWRLRGDLNNDGCTDFADFLLLLENWGQLWEGVVMDFSDFLALLENWGAGPNC